MNSDECETTMKSSTRRETVNEIPVSLNTTDFRSTFLGNSLRNLQLSIMPNLLLSGLIIDIFCYIYPAFCSLKAVKNNNGSEIIQWISYWILTSAFVLIEKMFVFATIEPIFSILRRSVCIWCLLPIPNNGATIIYHSVLARIMNNESPARVFQDLSQNISLDRMQRKAQEIREQVTEKFRGSRADATDHVESRQERSVSRELGESSTPGPMLPRIIDYSALEPTDDSQT